MTKKQYSDTDVENLLAAAARQDRRPMDDATTERFLSLIRGETERHAPALAYSRALQCAAVLVVLLACLPVLYLASSGGQANTVPSQAGMALVDKSDARKDPAPESSPVMGCGFPVAETVEEPQRMFLNHIDNTLNAGYSPTPQETYQGQDGQRYGAGAHGEYEFSACTDTL